LHKPDIHCHKTGYIPSKADTAGQLQHLENVLQPAIRQAQQGQAHLLFVDAAHFALATFLGWLWSFTRIFIKAPAGRQRLNVMVAVDEITRQLHFLSNATCINTDTMLTFLLQLREQYLNTLPLDNARYGAATVSTTKPSKY